MSDITTLMMAAAGQAGEEADPDFENTVLLLHGDGTNGAQNNTFLDSSTNNFTITRNGNTTQGSFSPFSKPDGRWGNYFDGSNDKIHAPVNSTGLYVSNNDFTIEAFFYPNATLTATRTLLTGQSNYASAGGSSYVMYVGPGNPNSDVYISTTGYGISSPNPTAGQWNHLALVRTSGTLSYFLNGSRYSTRSDLGTGAINDGSTNPFTIGNRYDNQTSVDGFISQVRVIVGSGGYDATQTTLTVPTAALTATANTKLLTCQSNRFIDNSASPITLTALNGVKVTPFSPFPLTTAYSPSVNGGSAYLDGSGDYLQAGSDAALAPSSGDFTIECWIYPTNNNFYNGIYQNYTDGNGRTTALRINTNNADQTSLMVQTAATALITTSTGVVNANAWNHIALVRNGAGSNNLVLYVNGVSAGTATNTTNFSDGYAQIGNAVYAGTNYYWNGGISALRVVPGTAVYTSAFTPPTAPLTAVSGTSLLCNFTNAGIYDSTGFNNLETVGNAQVDTTTKKYGTGSMEFDGTGDNLTIASNPSVWFGSGAFTIEMWLYPNDASSQQMLVAGSDTGSLFLGMNIDGANRIALGRKGVAVDNQVSYTYTTGAWIHLACTRDASNNIRFFVDGTQVGSTGTNSNSFANSALNIAFEPTQKYFNGYIDDLRITKGVARYTSNFTVPDKAFPDIGE